MNRWASAAVVFGPDRGVQRQRRQQADEHEHHEHGAVAGHQPRKTSTMSLEPAVSSRYSSE